MPGSGPLTTVEGSPWHPQRSARRRHADLRCERLDGHQQSFPCSRLNPSSPATFPLDVQDRMGGVQLLLQPSHFRLELVHLRAEGVALGGLPTAFARGQALKRPLTPRPAPFRQMGAVQTLAAKQPAHLAGLRAALCLLQNPQSILRGELAPLRLGHDLRVRRWPRVAGSGPGGLVATLLDPQGRSVHLLQCHRFSFCGHWYSPPPPYSNSKGGRCLSDVGREGTSPARAKHLGVSTAGPCDSAGPPLARPCLPARASKPCCHWSPLSPAFMPRRLYQRAASAPSNHPKTSPCWSSPAIKMWKAGTPRTVFRAVV